MNLRMFSIRSQFMRVQGFCLDAVSTVVADVRAANEIHEVR